MRCSTSLKDPVQASVTCLGGATSGAIPDLVRPRPAFGCNAVSCRTGRVRRHWGCHLYFARRVSFLSCADIDCRSPIETSPSSPIEMSRSTVGMGLVEVAWDDGDHDEPQRAGASAGVDRYR